MMGYISMYMFKLCLGIHKLTIYKARGASGLLDTTYRYPFLNPTTDTKKKKEKENLQKGKISKK